MGYSYSFDLTVAQLQEIMAPVAKGLFAGLKRKLMDKSVAGMFTYLAGPTTVEIAAEGLRVSNTQGTQEIPWSGIAAVNERRRCWVVQRVPNGLVLVPALVVPEGERAELAQRLREWAPTYNVREGGMDRASA